MNDSVIFGMSWQDHFSIVISMLWIIVKLGNG